MAGNTGYKQATIAFKVSRPGGEPLDINGDFTSVSGLRQAIALLTGTANPNENLYEVETYFAPSAVLTGQPTKVYDENTCRVGEISISTNSIILQISAPSVTFTITSSHDWTMQSNTSGIATVTPVSGAAGQTQITITRTATQGQTNYIFTNSHTLQTVTLSVLNVDVLTWILQTGFWNNNGLWVGAANWIY